MRDVLFACALICVFAPMDRSWALGLETSSATRSGGLSPSTGRSASKDLGPVRNDSVSVELTMTSRQARHRSLKVESRSRAEQAEWRAGDRVELCFTASADGFVTVWYHDMGKNPELIYPNERSHPSNDRAEPVTAGQQHCIGSGNDFGLQVDASENLQKVFVHWTKTLEESVPRVARLSLVPGEEEVTQTQAVAELVYRAQ